MVVFVAHEDALASAAHAVGNIMLFEALEARQNRRVLLRLGLLDSESVVRQRVQADCGGLVRVERERDNGRLRALESCRRDGRHCDARESQRPGSRESFRPKMWCSRERLFVPRCGVGVAITLVGALFFVAKIIDCGLDGYKKSSSQESAVSSRN